MSDGTVIVVAGGEPDGAAPPDAVPDGAPVIAADGGVDRAHALGLHVDLAIGDFDSVSDAGLAAAEAAGARIERHPTDEGRDRPRARARRGDRARTRRGSSCSARRGGRLDHLLARAPAPRRSSATPAAHIDAHRRRRARPRRPRSAGARRRARSSSSRSCRVHGAGRGRHDRRARVPASRRDARRPARPAASRTSSRAATPASTVDARRPPRRPARVRRDPRDHGARQASRALAVAGIGATLAGPAAARRAAEPKDVVLVTHDSFAISKPVKAAFEQETGSSCGSCRAATPARSLNRALLTKGNPQGDVLFGVDNTLLVARARRAACSSRTPRTGSPRVAARYQLDPTHRVTPVDHGDVCLNVDKRWFAITAASRRRRRSTTSRSPRYRKLLVVENPATSTPGLAFMLATIARYGEEGWQDYWSSSARTACTSSTAGRRRTRRASPGAAAARATGRSSSPTRRARRPRCSSRSPGRRPRRRRRDRRRASARSSSPACCTGRGTRTGAQALIDFMLSQAVPGGRPAADVRVPGAQRHAAPAPRSRSYAVVARRPAELPPAEIGRNRDRWIDEWTRLVLR